MQTHPGFVEVINVRQEPHETLHLGGAVELVAGSDEFLQMIVDLARVEPSIFAHGSSACREPLGREEVDDAFVVFFVRVCCGSLGVCGSITFDVPKGAFEPSVARPARPVELAHIARHSLKPWTAAPAAAGRATRSLRSGSLRAATRWRG